jgi:signal peptidase II
VLALVVALVTIAADQLAKMAVVDKIAVCDRVPVLGSVFRLTNIRNSGAVFGVMKGAGSYFTLFSVIAGLALVVAMYFARKSTRLVKISLGLVLGGAMGNLVDRLRFGAVVDFIDVGIGRARWPCFNIADAAITVGVVLLIYNALRSAGTETCHEGAELENRAGDGGEDRPLPE